MHVGPFLVQIVLIVKYFDKHPTSTPLNPLPLSEFNSVSFERKRLPGYDEYKLLKKRVYGRLFGQNLVKNRLIFRLQERTGRQNPVYTIVDNYLTDRGYFGTKLIRIYDFI